MTADHDKIRDMLDLIHRTISAGIDGLTVEADQPAFRQPGVDEFGDPLNPTVDALIDLKRGIDGLVAKARGEIVNVGMGLPRDAKQHGMADNP